MNMIIKMEYVYLFFIACIVIGSVIVIGIALIPPNIENVCEPITDLLIEKVNSYCICHIPPGEILNPFKK